MGYLVTEMQEKLLKIYEAANSTDTRKLMATAQELYPNEDISLCCHAGCGRGFLAEDGSLIKPTYSIICGPDTVAIFKDGTAHPC